ncbi:hypothetical protein SSPO_085960 [Streptomyces antimycoticus]|uniref:Uncharacterized protein n=1 Tax=Streptomyces antimycoticus TaxID=68175 RepID=A0A4D4JV16_9ACTN|nr:hypothetical protein SSPO_085960 [Streptomyces antimycoticus]GDY40575.1 hypothetical protein SANT12839_014570 [Streptomyces antimycoticus]
MPVQIVQLVGGELAQRTLPAHLRVVRTAQIRDGVAADGVEPAAEPLGLRDEGVDRVTLGRWNGGMVRGAGGRHDVLRYGRGAAGS